MKSSNFLKFKNATLYFIYKDGQYFIAYKPICDALSIDAKNVHRDLRNHKIFSNAIQNLPILITSEGKSQIRNMTCIPEKFIYLWIATLKADNEDLLSFQAECADVLHNHFHGSLGGRPILLETKYKIESRIEEIELSLQNNSNYEDLKREKKKLAEINKQLKKNDATVIQNNIDLFNYDNIVEIQPSKN